MNEVNKLLIIKKMGDLAADKVAKSAVAMFSLEVEMRISSVNMVSVDSISKLIGTSENEIVAGSYVNFSGFLSGIV